MAVIELAGVTKTYGDVVAVSELDLSVDAGEVFGFLGPNGAGKTTTIDIMLDFVRPDRGTVTVLGVDARRDSRTVRRRTGVLPEGASVYDRLTGRQHVAFAIESKDTDDDPDAILERVGLGSDGDRRAGGYSKGMRQRLLLAMALVGEPDLLILDEPSTGLDPNGAREMREIVREERNRGATVFFSSHLLSQVEAVCDRVGIMREGEMVAVDTIQELRAATGDARLRITVSDVREDAVAAVRAIDDVGKVAVEHDPPTVVVTGNGSKTAVLAALEDHGIDVIDFRTEEASLEELFHRYTSGEEEPA